MAVSRTSAGDHATHDELLLAALASGDDLPAASRERADALVRDCPDCATLVADIRLIRSAIAELPAPARRRDFRLTDDDAARLRPVGWRRLVAAFGSARLAFTTPLAAGFVAVGIVAAIVTVVPGATGPFSASTTVSRDVTGPGLSGRAAPEVAPVPSGAGDLSLPAPPVAAASLSLPAGAGAPAGGAPPSPSAAPSVALPAGAGAPAGGAALSPSPAPSVALPAGAGAPAGGAASAEAVSPAPDRLQSPAPSDAKFSGGQAPVAPVVPAATPAGSAPNAAGTASGLPIDGSTAAGIAAVPGESAGPTDLGQAAMASEPGPSGLPWAGIASILLVAAGLVLLGLRLAGQRVLGG